MSIFRPASGSAAIDALVRLIGRRRAWRIGRKLYLAARGEGVNAIAANGEQALIERAVAAFPEASPFRGWDVGANLGEWSDVLLATAATARVPVHIDLFEPTPTAFATLREKYRGEAAVTVRQVALSSGAGTAPFEVVGTHAGTNSLNLAGRAEGAIIDVAVARGADLHAATGGGELHLVKIDTEGHDLEVLRGLEPLLAAGAVGIVQFEYNWRWLISGSSLRAATLLADAHGYRFGRVAPGGIEIYDSWNADLDRYFETNYVLVRADVLPRLSYSVTGWCAGNLPVHRAQIEEA